MTKIHHDTPFWVPTNAIFFITICCGIRGKNSLAKPDIAPKLLGNLINYQEQEKWWIHLALIMPDHLHMLVTFSPSERMKNVVLQWKRFQSVHLNIEWQSDFFDHRIRSQDQFTEKYEYIRMNPVRKDLVQSPEDWPYVWDGKQS